MSSPTSLDADHWELLESLLCNDYFLRPRRPHHGTCEWVFTHPTYAKWAHTPGPAMLILTGKRGCGKSVLTGCVAERIYSRTFSTRHGIIGYVGASYFCSQVEATKRDDTVVIRSLLHQLVHINPDCGPMVRNSVERRTHRGELRLEFTSENLMRALQNVLAMTTMKHTLIVVDGVDELGLNASARVFSGLVHVVETLRLVQPESRLRVFVSTPPDATYLDVAQSPAAESIQIIDTKTPDTQKDIETYLRDKVFDLETDDDSFAKCLYFSHGCRDLREHIISTMAKHASGVFLLAVLYWENFTKGIWWEWDRNTITARLERVHPVPAGIMEPFYDRWLSKIDPTEKPGALDILCVMAAAARPLSKKEMRTVLGICHSMRSLEGSTKSIKRSQDFELYPGLNHIVKTRFSGLLRIHDRKVTFAHLTFKEYLENKRWPKEFEEATCRGHQEILQARMIFLKFHDILHDVMDGFSPYHALVDRYQVWDLYEKLLRHPKTKLSERNYRGETLLHHLIRTSSSQRVFELLDMIPAADVNLQDSSGSTPLHSAVATERKDVIHKLLAVPGIRLDLTDNSGRTPLTLATNWGHREVTLILIEPSQLFQFSETQTELSPLILAAAQGDKDLFLRLLEACKFQDLSCHMDMSGKGILHHTAINDWSDLIESCFRRGGGSIINVNHMDRSGCSALNYGAAAGNVASCRELVESGASVTLQDRNGRTAAHAAADAGFKNVLVLLVQSDGVDVKQRDCEGRNLVHWAATLDCVDVMQMIAYMPGAELDRHNKHGKTPIDIAFICQSKRVGQFLAALLPHLDRNEWDSMYQSPEEDLVEGKSGD